MNYIPHHYVKPDSKDCYYTSLFRLDIGLSVPDIRFLLVVSSVLEEVLYFSLRRPLCYNYIILLISGIVITHCDCSKYSDKEHHKQSHRSPLLIY